MLYVTCKQAQGQAAGKEALVTGLAYLGKLAGLGGVIAVFNGHVYHLVLVVAQAAQRPRAFLILRHVFLDSILKDVPLRLGGSSFQNPSIDCSLHIRRA